MTEDTRKPAVSWETALQQRTRVRRSSRSANHSLERTQPAPRTARQVAGKSHKHTHNQPQGRCPPQYAQGQQREQQAVHALSLWLQLGSYGSHGHQVTEGRGGAHRHTVGYTDACAPVQVRHALQRIKRYHGIGAAAVTEHPPGSTATARLPPPHTPWLGCGATSNTSAIERALHDQSSAAAYTVGTGTAQATPHILTSAQYCPL